MKLRNFEDFHQRVLCKKLWQIFSSEYYVNKKLPRLQDLIKRAQKKIL